MLVPLDQLNESSKRYKEPSISVKEAPADADKKLKVAPEPAEPPESPEPGETKPSAGLTVAENLEKRKQMLARDGAEPLVFAFERAIGKNDSVYSNFCELITNAKRKVGRIVVKDGNSHQGYATGFMVSERLLLTNWHVFKSRDDVRDSEVEFFYELDIFGRPQKPTIFRFAAGEFYHSNKELDYCLIAVETRDISQNISLDLIGYHYLNPTLGKLGEEGKELLNIIHHPDGDYKQLSIRENRYKKILENTIWYETDTAQGSSGSPVFNDQWQVVALHHMGVPKKTSDGKNYLDKNDKIIEPVDGKIDAAKVHWIANEGIRISKLLADVFKAFPSDSFIMGLKKKSSDVATIDERSNPHSPNPEANHRKEDKTMDSAQSTLVRISFPSSLLETAGNVSVNISTRATAALFQGTAQALSAAARSEEDLLEVKKVELENAVDYSQCNGYDENFLGIKLPIPKPKKSLQKFVAKVNGTSRPILDYHHFSAIHHSVRKMPIISAINVDGNPALRKDETKREDVWLRDVRLDMEVQLNDKFYAKSGFDKGHMSRREDANWGKTAAEAKEFADLTCVYTNACPQVPELNRSNRDGLWGKLEKVILEKGAIKEKGKFAKISVFNGPIFSEDDRFFKGIQVPMEYWKVIFWFNEKGELQATGFKLSQADLVDDIDFEKLGFDNNAEFKEFRCSLKLLTKLTKLDFSPLEKFDTFSGADEEELLPVESESKLDDFVNEVFIS
jgi:endonuclease G